MASHFSSISGSSYRRSRRAGFRPNSEINVTPLVDVMLVLLIIFMVTAPILTVGIPVDLPKTTAAQTNDQVEPVVVSIDKEGKTYLKEDELSLDEIIASLGSIVDKNPEAKIYVRGDKSLSYGRIMEVMGIIASAGFQRVSLIAEMPTSQPSAPSNIKNSQDVNNTSSVHSPKLKSASSRILDKQSINTKMTTSSKVSSSQGISKNPVLQTAQQNNARR